MANKRVISGVLTLKDKNFSSGMKKAGSQSSDLERKVKSTGNQVKSFSKSAVAQFGKVAGAIGGLATAAGAIGIASVIGRDIIATESAFDRLEAKTGITGTKLEDLQGVASDVFKDGFGDSIGTVTNDIATLQTMFQDLNKNELKDLATGASTISDLWDVGINEVGRTVKTLTANFDDLSEATAMDLMTTAFQKTGDYAGDLLDTFNEYGGYFADMGMDAQDFTNLLIKGAEAGAFNLDKVGDAVKEFSVRSIDGSKSTAEGFEAIGLNASDMESKIAEGGDTAQGAFSATIAGLASMDDEVARNQAGVQLFGAQWEDLRSDVVLAMTDGTDALGDFEGATKKAGDAAYDNFGTRMTSMWREVKMGAVEAFQDNGGDKLLDAIATKAEGLIPLVGEVVEGAINFGENVQAYWPQIKSYADEIVDGVVAVKDGIVGVYNFIADNWSLIGPVVGGVTATILAFKVGVVAVTAAKKTWEAVTTGLAIAQGLLNGAIAISPLGWVAIAIGVVIAAGIALWQNWDTVKAAAQGLWDKMEGVGAGIKSGWDATWNFVKSVAEDSVNGVIDKINGLVGVINKIPGVDVPIVAQVDWTDAEAPKGAIGASGVSASYAVGTNRVPRDMVAQIHKDEMIIPSRESERLRKQGITIDNIAQTGNKQTKTRSKSTGNNSSTNGVTLIIEKINAQGITAMEVLNELIPLLKLKLANI